MDGVEAVPPEGKTAHSRKVAGPRFSVPVFWRDGLHPVRAASLAAGPPDFFSVMDGVEAVPPEGKTAHSPDGSGAACPPYEGASPPQQPPGGNRGMSDRARHGMRRLVQTKRAAARPLLCFILLKGLLAQLATNDHRQRAQAQQAHRRRLRNRNLLVGLDGYATIEPNRLRGHPRVKIRVDCS